MSDTNVSDLNDEIDRSKQEKPDENPSKSPRLKIIFSVVLATLALGSLCIYVTLSYFGRDLPDYRSLNEYRPPQMSRVLDREGIQLGRFFDVRRTIVPFAEIAPIMVQFLPRSDCMGKTTDAPSVKVRFLMLFHSEILVSSK